MHWLVDGYNVIRRGPELAEREQESLEAGRQALCLLLSNAARVSGDRFTVVFDGNQRGDRFSAGPGVHAIFSSARETADQVLARMATAGGGGRLHHRGGGPAASPAPGTSPPPPSVLPP